MAIRLNIILSLLIICALNSYTQNLTDDNFLRETVALSGQARVTIPLAGRDLLNYMSRNFSVTGVKEGRIEMVLSPLTLDHFLSLKTEYRIVKVPDARSLYALPGVSKAGKWESYPTYTRYDSIMQSFPALYPSLCDLDTIGTSINGRLVLVLKISDNVSEDEDEPAVFYSSTIHGDETAGFILMLRLADYLLENYGTDSRVRNIVDNLEIWINPLSNPDGTYRTGDTIISPVRFNANGYDLNRNFPDPETPGTVIQKETLDMVKFMRKRRFVLSANFHSGSEVVNFPWDSRWWLHADNDWFYNISREYADTVHMYSVPGYMTFLDNGVTNGYEWYSINGGRQDFITWELQGREVTIELHDEYITPESQLNSIWQYNYRSLLGYLENALYGIRGQVKDKETGEPVPARIFITGYDKDSSHVYSDTLTGSYLRMLAPGIYDLKFSAAGYADQVINDIIVNEGEQTSVNVEMVSFINPVDTTETQGLIIYPNPSDDHFNLVLPERQYGRINIKIFSTGGLKLKDYYRESAEDMPIRINVTDLQDGIYILQVTNKSSGMTDRTCFVVVRK